MYNTLQCCKIRASKVLNNKVRARNYTITVLYIKRIQIKYILSVLSTFQVHLLYYFKYFKHI